MISHVAPLGKMLKCLLSGVVLASLVVSAEANLTERKISCDEAYECPEGSTLPFQLGYQYVYVLRSDSAFQVRGGLPTYPYHDSIIITPTSGCEALIFLNSPESVEHEGTLKIAMVDGIIKRTCYFQENDLTSQTVNVLKAVASLLPTQTENASESDNIENVHLEESSIGICMTKYVKCPEADITIKYQSTVYCGPTKESMKIRQNFDENANIFLEELRSQSSAHNNFCDVLAVGSEATEVSDFMASAYDKAKNLAVCVNLMKDNGTLFKTSHCYQRDLLGLDPHSALHIFDAKVILDLKESREVSSTQGPTKSSFVKTSLQQIFREELYIHPKLGASENVIPSIEEVIDALVKISSTANVRDTLSKMELLEKAESYKDDLIKGFEILTNSETATNENLIRYLSLVSNLPKSKSVFDFFAKVLPQISAKSLLSAADLSFYMEKTLVTMATSKGVVSSDSLEFVKFLSDFVNQENVKFSREIRFKALILLGERIDQFCLQMEIKTGERYCAKDPIILEWTKKLFLDRLNEMENRDEKLWLLDGLSSFDEHLDGNLCEATYESSKGQNDPVALWALQNCQRKQLCSTKSKNFLRSVFENKQSFSNARVAAFLTMTQCWDNDDNTAIENLFDSFSSEDKELVTFLKRYQSNRNYYGIKGVVDLPEDTAISADKTFQVSPKASNSFISFPIRNLVQRVDIETNIFYFDKPAMIPNLVTMKVSAIPTGESDLFNAYDVQILVNDRRNLGEENSELDFLVNVIVKVLGSTVYIKKVPVTKENLMQLYLAFQQFIQKNYVDNSIGLSIREKLHDYLKDGMKYWEMLDMTNFGEVTLHPSVSGITWRNSKKMDSILRFNAEIDCPIEVVQGGKDEVNDIDYGLKIGFDIRQNMGVFLGFQKMWNKEEGFLTNLSVGAAFPLTLRRSRKTNDDLEILKLTLPSSNTPLIQYEVVGDLVEVIGKQVKSSFTFGHGTLSFTMMDLIKPQKSSKLTVETMSLVLIKQGQGMTLEIDDSAVQGRIEVGSDPLYLFSGNFNYSLYPARPSKQYSFKVGAQNTEREKKLETEIQIGQDKYSLKGFYIHHIKNKEEFKHHGFLSCRGKEGGGILCWWPFCAFCGSEYFFGATFVTPSHEFKLFDGSVTQTFPNNQIEMVLETSGIPIIREGKLRVKIQRGNDTTLYQESSLYESINQKLEKYKFKALHQTNSEHGGGDALPESETNSDANESVASRSYFYLLEAELSGHYIGRTEFSMPYLFSRNYPTSDKYNEHLFNLFGVKLSHVGFADRSVTFYRTISVFPKLNDGNHSTVKILETNFRTSKFPILNNDFTVLEEEFRESPNEKTTIVLEPMNLLNGTIRVEVMNTAKFKSIEDIFQQPGSWRNIHLNQTYKIYLPRQFNINNLKVKLGVKRENEKLETAYIDAILGFNHGFEFKYERLPEDGAVKITSSVTYNEAFYGLNHKIELGRTETESHEVSTTDDDNDNTNVVRLKYSGTYVFDDTSLKAKGYFLGPKGGEILPFSKFDIRVASVEGKDIGVRIFGLETVKEKAHKMKIGVSKGDSNLFEFTNEINPDEKIPMKASISLKDYGEAKIYDTSKFKNSRNLQVKASLLKTKQIVEGKIKFPMTLEEPMYLDADLAINEDRDGGNPIFRITTSSSLDYSKNFAATSENSMQIRDSKWEFNFEGIHSTEYNGLGTDFKYLRNSTFFIEYIQPNEKKYGLHISSEKQYYKVHNFKLFVRGERPDITPLIFHVESDRNYNYKREDFPEGDENHITYRRVEDDNNIGLIKICHQDNFLYIFPKLDVNLEVELFHLSEETVHYYTSGMRDSKETVKFGCKSEGIRLPMCNQINVSYDFESSYYMGFYGPWVWNVTAVNNPSSGYTDELEMKFHASFDKVKPVNFTGYGNIVLALLNTVHGEYLYKHVYNLEYDLQRKRVKQGLAQPGEYLLPELGLNGKYVLSNTFESLDNFEIFDELRWKMRDHGDFHIWTSKINHTVEQSSEYASLFSQYVSLEDENSGDNITYMELRSTLNTKGFGSVKAIILQPSTLLQVYEGNIETDFLIRSEYTFLKNFRLLLSHEHNSSENEDDESTKYETLSKLNGIFNEREILATNSMTLTLGKFLGLGNSFLGRCRNPNGTYEYATIKSFILAPRNTEKTEKPKLLHLDVFSSWTNAEDDDTDLRITNDFISPSSLINVPVIRFSMAENSTDLVIEKNFTLLLYPSEAGKETKTDIDTKFTDTIFSENLEELNFAQIALQSISQQILDDYHNSLHSSLNAGVENSNDNSGRFDYNLLLNSRSALEGNSSSIQTQVKLYEFEEILAFKCQANVDICIDNEQNSTNSQIDASNYCNLAIHPVKYLLHLLYYGM